MWDLSSIAIYSPQGSLQVGFNNLNETTCFCLILNRNVIWKCLPKTGLAHSMSIRSPRDCMSQVIYCDQLDIADTGACLPSQDTDNMIDQEQFLVST